MKNIHIIFNIDYKQKNGQLNFFRQCVVNQIKETMIELPSFEQFKTLVSIIENCKCYIWVHPSLGSELVSDGYDSEILTDVVPELEAMKLDYTKITRTNNYTLKEGITHVNQMIASIKNKKSYTASELKKMIEEKERQDILIKSYSLNKKLLIVTATTIEAKTVLKAFKKKKINSKHMSVNKVTYWNFDPLGNSEICLIKHSEMGSSKSSGSALVIKDAVDGFNPDFVIMVGIAFGLKKDKQVIGQILISKELENYESGKITETGVIGRGQRIPAGTILLDRFDNASINYNKSKIEVGLIISGDKLVDSKAFIDSLRERYPDAIGGEMEGTGLQSACLREKKEWILIKGICDWGFDKQHENKDQDQELAIHNVCDFLIYTLKNFDL